MPITDLRQVQTHQVYILNLMVVIVDTILCVTFSHPSLNLHIKDMSKSLVLCIYTIILHKYVVVCKLQVAILARSSREMSVRIDWKHFHSWVRISVRPSNCFMCEKHPKIRRNRVARASVYLNETATGHDWTSKRGVKCITVGHQRPTEQCDNLNGDGSVCVMCLQYTIILFDPGW